MMSHINKNNESHLSKLLFQEHTHTQCIFKVPSTRLGDMPQKIITIIIFISVDIDNYPINVKSYFFQVVKPYFCSKVKVLETRPLIFLNTIII